MSAFDYIPDSVVSLDMQELIEGLTQERQFKVAETFRTAGQQMALQIAFGETPPKYDFKFMFGRYRGESVKAVQAKNPNYLKWLNKNFPNWTDSIEC